MRRQPLLTKGKARVGNKVNIKTVCKSIMSKQFFPLHPGKSCRLLKTSAPMDEPQRKVTSSKLMTEMFMDNTTSLTFVKSGLLYFDLFVQ